MAERNSWSVSDTGGVLSVEDVRVATGALVTPGGSTLSAVKAKTGLRPSSGSPGRVTASSTPDAFVHVAPFQAFLQTSRASVGGAYVITLDAIEDVNVLSTPAHATNPRDDLIIAQQSDKFYGDGSNAWTVRHVVGTPSGTPVDPTIDGSADYIQLARVRVGANVTTITNANITDLRGSAPWTVALGGIAPVGSQTGRDSLTGTYGGYPIWRSDRSWIELMTDAGTWRVPSVPVVATTGDLSAITTPYSGMLAVVTADGFVYRYNGSAWISHVSRQYRAVTTLGASAASVSFTSIPSTLRALEVSWTARDDWAAFEADTLFMRVNNDSGTNYRTNAIQVNNTTVTGQVATAQTRAGVGLMARGGASANVFGSGSIRFGAWNAPHTNHLGWTYQSIVCDSLDTKKWSLSGGGVYIGAGPYTRLDFLVEQAGQNFVAGTQFTLIGWE